MSNRETGAQKPPVTTKFTNARDMSQSEKQSMEALTQQMHECAKTLLKGKPKKNNSTHVA